MKDYRVEVKIKNNYLLTKMMENGVANVAQLAKLANANPSQIGDIANLKTSAYDKCGKVRPTVSKICEFLACCPDDIFPVQHLMTPLHSNRSVVEADQEDLIPGYLLEGTVDPLVQLAEEDSAKHVHKLMALTRLTARETKILTASFGLDGDAPKTYTAIGKELGITDGRVQQIANKILRKMRSCAKKSDWYKGTDGELYDELSGKAKEGKAVAFQEYMEKSITEVLQAQMNETPYYEIDDLISKFTYELGLVSPDDEAKKNAYELAITCLNKEHEQGLENIYWGLIDRVSCTPDAEMGDLYEELSRKRRIRTGEGRDRIAAQYQRVLDLFLCVEVSDD